MLAFATRTLIAVPGGTSPRGIPMWILRALLVPFGIWVIVRAIRSLRTKLAELFNVARSTVYRTVQGQESARAGNQTRLGTV